MFRLNDKEIEKLSRCKNFTTIQTKGMKGGRVYNPYAFTESGIYMLMTVLKGELATKQSKTLIRIFKKMKDFMVNNDFMNQLHINNLVFENYENIKLLINKIKELI